MKVTPMKAVQSLQLLPYKKLGKSAAQIAKEHGLVESAIFAWFRKLGIKRKLRRLNITKEELKILLPLKTSEIAERLGVSDVTVLNFMKKFGFERSRSHENLKSKEWLQKQYRTHSTIEIAAMLNTSDVTVGKWLKKHDIAIHERNGVMIGKKISDSMASRSAADIQIANNKRAKTMRLKYGVDNAMKSGEIKKRAMRSFLEKYGVTQAEFLMTKQNSGRISKVELICLALLEKNFDVVEHQKRTGEWLIDFYIPSIDVYVQIDGTFWHGLDGLYLTLPKSSPRRQKVEKRIAIDKQQNEAIKRLIRISDKDFKKRPEILLEKIYNIS